VGTSRTAAKVAAEYFSEVEGMSCTATAIEVPDDLPRERWEAALRWLGTVERARQWWIGDLLVHAGKKYGETFDAAMEATGLALSTLKAYKRVASKFPPDVRRPDVPWATHRILASESEPERREWLARAGEGRSSADLDHRQTPEPADDEAFDAQAHWAEAGMPEYERREVPPRLVVSFESRADRDDLMERLGSPTVHVKEGDTLSIWWPDRPKDDCKALEFVDA
jgi:hypothetical protein